MRRIVLHKANTYQDIPYNFIHIPRQPNARCVIDPPGIAVAPDAAHFNLGSKQTEDQTLCDTTGNGFKLR